MGIYVRESKGVSWRDPRQPGVRHYRSSGVSVGLGWWLISRAFWWVIVMPVVVMIWMILQVGFLAASAILALVFMGMYRRSPRDLRLVRWGPFILIDVRLP